MAATASTHDRENQRRGFIQCEQCSEEFPRNTVVCRRCNRVNSRNPVIIGLKVLGMAVFVCAVSLLVRAIAGAGRLPGTDEISRASDLAPTAPAATQADVRF